MEIVNDDGLKISRPVVHRRLGAAALNQEVNSQ